MKKTDIFSTGMITLFLLCTTNIAAHELTIDTLLHMIRKNNLVFEKKDLATKITNEKKQGLTETNQWNLAIHSGYSYNEPAKPSNGIKNTNIFSGSTELHRHFWKTGGQFSTGYSAMRNIYSFNSQSPIPDKSTESKIYIKYVQPLLKNWKGKLSSLQYKATTFDSTIVQLESTISENEISAKAVREFLQWALLEEEKDILLKRKILNEELLEKTKRKHKSNMVDKIDVIRSEDAVRFGELTIATKNAEIEAIKQNLAELAGDSSIRSAKPQFDIYDIPAFFNVNEIESLIDSTYTLKLLEARKNQLKIFENGLKESAKPDLSIFIEANTKNSAQTTIDALKMDNPDFIAGISFTTPIGKKAEQAKIRENRLQQMEIDRNINEIKNQYKASVLKLLTQQKEMEQTLKTSNIVIQSADEKTSEELKRYNQGRSLLAFVIMSRDEKLNAQLTHAGLCTSIQQLQIEIQALLNRL